MGTMARRTKIYLILCLFMGFVQRSLFEVRAEEGKRFSKKDC